MKIYTTRFGEIEVNENTIISFPSGILGFPDAKRFVLLDVDESSPLKWMQAIDEPALAFVVTDPNLFKADYVVNAQRSDLKDIEVEKAEDVVVLVLVTVPREPSRMTANLKGPILINVKINKAKQLIVDDVDYDIKYRLLPDDMIEQVV